MKKINKSKSASSKTSPPSYIVLTDFDGTISCRDVGNRMFNRFASGDWEQVVENWKQGRISSRECLIAECSLARATLEQITRFALSQEIDPHFKLFLSYCQSRDIPVIILSDGLDFYIDLLLRKYGLEELHSYANHLEFQGSTLIPSFPYFHKGCGSCGNCKDFHVRRYQVDGRKVIYIGDGFSDRCGVKNADLVFAKRDLRRYCRQQGIEHVPFRDFGEVLSKLRELVEGQVSGREGIKKKRRDP